MIKCRKSIDGLRAYVPGRPIEDVKKEYGLTEVAKLASNENPYGASELAKNAVRASVQNLSLYPDGACTELRVAIAKRLGTAENTILFGTGTDEVISIIAQAFTETGDEMITGDVTFGQYGASVTAMGGNVTLVPMKDYAYDLDGILAAITDKTKMIFIASPNNPTGTIISDKKKIEFINKIPNDVLIVLDEAYEEYVTDENYSSSVPLAAKYDNLIVLKTFSKIYGLASLRVGYGIMNERLWEMCERIRKPFNVSIPAQAAALASINDEGFVPRMRLQNQQCRLYCYERLDAMGLPYIKSEGNFIMIEVKRDGNEVFEQLQKKGYIIRPGSPFGLQEFIRVTIGTRDQMEGFFSALVDVLDK